LSLEKNADIFFLKAKKGNDPETYFYTFVCPNFIRCGCFSPLTERFRTSFNGEKKQKKYCAPITAPIKNANSVQKTGRI
jgi:hypothetical protein